MLKIEKTQQNAQSIHQNIDCFRASQSSYQLYSQSSPRSQFFAGARDTFPLIVGAIPFGIIFGTLAATAGLSFAATMGMSLFVFAGSAQFISVSLVSAGTSWLIIVLTTFVVNLRHLLYGATMVPFYKNLSYPWKVILSFGLTDETFAVAINNYYQKDHLPYKHYYNLGSMLFMYSNWNLCTLIGLTAGKAFPEIAGWGLDFAMPATFIGMVIPYLVSKPMWIAVITAGIVSILFAGLPHKLGLMVAAVFGVAIGVISEIILSKLSNSNSKLSDNGSNVDTNIDRDEIPKN